MALPDYAALSVGTAIVLADSTDHSPSTNYNLGTRTDQIDMTSLSYGAARQSAKIDFGATWDMEVVLAAVIEWDGTPAPSAGETLDYYIGYSHSGTAAVGNPANLSGSDAAYTGISGGSLSDSLKQLTYIGSQVMDAVDYTNMPQVDTNIATFVPRDRYACLVVYNNAASSSLHSSMAESSIRLTPIRTSVVDT